MTDSMKFGPEWLRNMSAEPSVVGSSNSMSAVVGNNAGGNNVVGGMNSTSGLSLHSIGGGGVNQSQTTAASRNLFPEYRYGREEMLSLFDRNCLLPQILPSFKKLFVEKVQYPLALTPSSEEEIMNSQNTLGSGSRPAWLQRSASGFGISSRGSSVRVGATIGDRGRMRGKSGYHPIYQRPSVLYDDNNLSATPIKPDRNWNERNGIGDSSGVGIPSSCSGVVGIDWNGTPSSSPRKEFSSHNRNMENWRRNRIEDGSGDGPTTSNLVGIEVAGWRSGANQQRWGRSTSWRDEDSTQSGNIDGTTLVGNTASNVHRSISAIGTIGTDRTSANAKMSGAAGGIVGVVSRQIGSSKANLSQWTGNSLKSNADGDDNLPEWAMENPSEMGGSFDASGAFHGDSAESELYEQITKNTRSRKQAEPEKISALTKESENLRGANGDVISSKNNCKIITSQNQATDSESNAIVQTESVETADSTIQQKTKQLNTEETAKQEITQESTPTHKNLSANLGDISERFQEVANEVEKLIDDDGGDASVLNSPTASSSIISSNSRYELSSQLNIVDDEGHQQLHQLHSEAATKAMLNECLSSHKPLPFAEQLAMQHHLQQQHLSSVLPPHLINVNPHDLWFYRDPQSNVQGPFSAIEMTEWYRAGYFNENLFVRRFADSRFRALGDLIKLCQGNMPFTHSHMLPTPMELDNLQISLTSRKPTAAFNLPSFSLGDQQQQHNRTSVDDELELKASVTAAANSLSAAVKGHNVNVSTNAHNVDTSHMLTLRFQMLQDQYLQHQEYQIHSELSKNECFQGLDAGQREAIVRSKVQMLVLPEYLSSFSGLSNSLAALNPIAGSQLYDAIAQQAKKDQQQQHQQIIFPNNVDQRPFLDANDFILNAQIMHQQLSQDQQKIAPDQQETTNKLNALPSADIDLLNEYNLRMLLRGPTTTRNIQINQQQQLSSVVVKPNAGVDFMTNEPQLLATQNLMMPIWQQQHVNQQWPAMPKNAKVTLWDVATLEGEQNQQLLQQQQLNAAADCSANTTVHLEFEAAPLIVNHQLKSDAESEVNANQRQQRTQQKAVPLISEDNIPHRKDQEDSRQPQQQHELHFKQVTGKQQQAVNKTQLGGKLSDIKINDDDRRREQTEEKKRLKEERKRQQQEDEKRRAILAEEEKIRHQHEEKERQQQIQAQRRKALLGNSQATAVIMPATYTIASGNKTIGGVKIEQQPSSRPQSTSMAPWSLQPPSINAVAPGLAEIQKAERRERRADLQRQQEQLDKQIRANAAAAAEANDALLKWQASPAPAQVMSLVDIQAEEAKRLANELIEQQRRQREHEQQQHSIAVSSNNMGVSGALPNIWGNANKAWSGGSVVTNSSSTATNNSVMWDDTNVPQTPSKSASVGPSAASVLATVQQTIHKPQVQAQPKTSGMLPTTPRNLRKSQTLPVMQQQNVLSRNVKAQVHQVDKNKIVQHKTTISKPSSSGNEDKKSNAKSQQHSSSDSGLSHKSTISEYENEFTIWCMKSLDNMSAKVDVPTFVTFLQDLEAPYEVKDYVRIYLGEGKDSSDFVKQFLERRSKYKSLQRAQNAHNDDMCKPAPAITPSNDYSDNKNKQKKIKKSKMTKMDARILGFSVTAAEGRINVGSRDYVDGP
ncbi:hypothetical protein KR044_004432 [Drosophila immigrans]|nr:hypothetical protein KR044_004432 [Drosophila immigrans]